MPSSLQLRAAPCSLSCSRRAAGGRPPLPGSCVVPQLQHARQQLTSESSSAAPVAVKGQALLPGRRVVSCAASASSSNGAVGDSHAGHAVLHDFCMTLPYGAIALAVGVVSFFVGGAVLKSLAVPLAGVGAGTLLLAVLSLKGWKQGKSTAPYTLLTAGLAGGAAYLTVPLVSGGVVGWVAGGVAGLSAAAGLFCLYNVLAGGNPPRKGSH